MRRAGWFGILALAVALALPAMAGGENCSKSAEQVAKKSEKCSHDTQVCLNAMVTKLRNRGWVGIELDHGEDASLTVTRVEPDSPAKSAGLREGDILLAVNGIAFGEENNERLKKAKKEMTVGATVTYTVKRGGYEKEVPVTLSAIPEPVLAKWVGAHMLEHATVEIAQY